MKLEWSAKALADLDRFALFLQDRFPDLSQLVGTEIARKAQTLERYPELGRPLAGREEYREVTLQALRAKYIFRYFYDGNRLVMLRVFHGREDRSES